ncbi:MAG: cation-efflux pump [Candidatus Bathyarchaeia archaeon]|nr:cation-efflux pump [Candidatus Bathyarchaeota archaeon]
MISNSYGKLRAASVILISVIIVTIVKAIAALLTGSLILKTETFDSILDILNIVMVYFALRISMAPPDVDHHYGHGKTESLVAFIEALFIVIIVVVILYEAVQRVINPILIVNHVIGISLITLTTLIDLALFIYSRRTSIRYLSPALEACSINMLGDISRSIPELACLVFIAFSNLYLVDVAVSIVLSIILAREAYRLLLKSSGILLDRAPTGVAEKISSIVSGIEAVEDVKHVRVRSLGNRLQVDVSLSLRNDYSIAEAHGIADHIEDKIKSVYTDADVTIHIEPPRKADIETIIRNIVSKDQNVKNVHSIRIYTSRGRVALIFHVELDPSISLNEAHRISEEIEGNLRQAIPNLGFISIHMETSLERTEATLREVRDEKIAKTIEEARMIVQGVEEIHEAVIIESKGMKLLTLHLELKPDTPLKEAHRIASSIEAYLKEKLGVDEVDIHLEPRKSLNQKVEAENISGMDP